MPTRKAQASPDPGVFFDSPEYTRLTELIRHLSENSTDMLLLLGEKGAGKTTLLYHIISMAPAHWAICRVDANPMMRPDQMFVGLARSISAPVDTQESSSVLIAAFSARRLQGQLPVVLVDDADQLPLGSLMALVRLHESTGDSMPPFALIFLAEPAIAQTLATQQFHAMGTARFNQLELPRLEHVQIEAYIRHYLNMEGVNQELKVNKVQLQRIHQESAGLPGKVNELVLQVLHDPEHGQNFSLATAALGRLATIPPLTGAAFSGLIVLLVASLVFQDEINRLFEKPPASDPGAVPSGLPFRPGDKHDSGHQVLALPLPVRKTHSGSGSEAQVDRPAVESVAGGSASASPEGGAENDRAMSQKPPSRVSDSGPDTEVEPMQEPIPNLLQQPTPTVEQFGVESAVPPGRSRTLVQSRLEFTPKPIPAKPTQESSNEGAADVPDQTARDGKDVAWLAAQRPDAYTLQVIGVSNEQAALQFIRSRKFDADVVYFESRRKGRPWFAVLHGLYPDRHAAMLALERLPASLREIGAWPRSLGSVQEEMKGH